MAKRSRKPKTPKSAIKRSLFAHEERERKIDGMGDPLAVLERHIDFAAIAEEVDAAAPRPSQERGGRPPYPTEVMVRILALKHLYNLADEALEFQLLDRLSFQRFCGLVDSSNIPDRTTVWHFEQRLREAGAEEAIFAAVQRQLHRSGYTARCGQIIDATIVEAPRQHFTGEEREILEQGATPAAWNRHERRQRDTDARWTKKHGRSFFGYKLSVNADGRYKLIRRIVVSDAAEHDSRHFNRLIERGNTNAAIYADRGYASDQRERALREMGYRPEIQRKAKPGKPLGERQRRRNQRIAKIRARVEHVFAAIPHAAGAGIRCIGQARATFQLTVAAAAYNLRRLAYLREAGIEPF